MANKEVENAIKEVTPTDEAAFDRLVAAIDKAYHRPWRMFFRAFFQGIATVLGGTVGASIVFALLFYILSSLNFAPLAEKVQKLVIPEKILNELNGSPSPASQQLSPQATHQAMQ